MQSRVRRLVGLAVLVALSLPRPAGAANGGAPARALPPPHGATGPPSWAIAVAVIAALLTLGSALWALARSQAWQPAWGRNISHALAEAGFRAQATWAEFTDWLRLGH